MRTKFGKKVLKEYSTIWNCKEYICYILDGGNYVDIHIIDDSYTRDALNTLKMQDEKQYLPYYLTDVKCDALIIEHILWDKHSTNQDILSFSVEIHKD